LRSNQDENVHLTNNFVDLQNGLFASTQVYNLDTTDFNKSKVNEITSRTEHRVETDAEKKDRERIEAFNLMYDLRNNID